MEPLTNSTTSSFAPVATRRRIVATVDQRNGGVVQSGGRIQPPLVSLLVPKTLVTMGGLRRFRAILKLSLGDPTTTMKATTTTREEQRIKSSSISSTSRGQSAVLHPTTGIYARPDKEGVSHYNTFPASRRRSQMRTDGSPHALSFLSHPPFAIIVAIDGEPRLQRWARQRCCRAHSVAAGPKALVALPGESEAKFPRQGDSIQAGRARQTREGRGRIGIAT